MVVDVDDAVMYIILSDFACWRIPDLLMLFVLVDGKEKQNMSAYRAT
jgi:hypothetical protein